MESNRNQSGLRERFFKSKVCRAAVVISAISGIGLAIRDTVSVDHNERLTCQLLADGDDLDKKKFDFVSAPYVPAGPLVPRSDFLPLIPEKFISFRNAGARVPVVINNCRDRFGIFLTPSQVRAGVDKVLKAE